ncbi:solute carrier family 35 member G1-like [Rhodnius prolixus]|uniref:EamA domain-containing protein n=1 Tax=Rhodnius prolixus TaxID=13249 RepID=T1HU02_RHOPR
MDERVEMQYLVQDDNLRDAHHSRFIEKSPKWKPNPYLGIILATVSSFFFSICSVIVKWMVNVHPIELAAYRFVGVLLPAIPIAVWRKEHLFPKGKRLMLILRSFLGTTTLMLSFYAFRHMPLADASVIVFSVPVFVAVFAFVFLKEPCDAFSVLTICLTLTGVLLITRPISIFGTSIPSLGSEDNITTDLWGGVSAFTATLFGANAYILLRVLKGLHFSVIMINFGTFALIETFCISWFLGVLCLPQCGPERLLILALGIFSFGGQFLLTISLQLEQAGPVSIARSADIVFAFIWQILFFKEVPNIYSILGAFFVISSVILIGFRKWVLTLPDNSAIKKTLQMFSK